MNSRFQVTGRIASSLHVAAILTAMVLAGFPCHGQDRNSTTEPPPAPSQTYPGSQNGSKSGSNDRVQPGNHTATDGNRLVGKMMQPIDSNNSLADDEVSSTANESDWLQHVRVGYDGGFVIASESGTQLNISDAPFSMKINGWGQLRQTLFDSRDPGSDDVNQFQLKRGRIVFSGSAFTSDFKYFVQLDARSSSGDDIRLLDFFLAYDLGHHSMGLEKGVFGFKTGKYKMPFTMARYLSGREFEFADRSMASTFFDVNRSFAWGLFGKNDHLPTSLNWEFAIFNGLVTGGAETGSTGSLDNNFAYSARLFAYPTGEWGEGELADLDWHETLATRFGIGIASSTIEATGSTEFSSARVVDSGRRLSNLLDPDIDEYSIMLYAVDASFKLRGWSGTMEYYFRNIYGFRGGPNPDLYDHGFWLQFGYFAIPNKLQLLTRWSRVQGKSGTLGMLNESAEEISGGFAWYFRGQNAKFVFDVTNLNGAPINSAALDMTPGAIGWLVRTQIQFAF